MEAGKPKHKAFILDQSDELTAAGPLEIDIDTPQGVEEVTVAQIANLTDLEFEGS